MSLPEATLHQGDFSVFVQSSRSNNPKLSDDRHTLFALLPLMLADPVILELDVARRQDEPDGLGPKLGVEVDELDPLRLNDGWRFRRTFLKG